MYFNWTEIFCYKIDFNYLFSSGEKSIKCRLICYRACFVKIYVESSNGLAGKMVREMQKSNLEAQ